MVDVANIGTDEDMKGAYSAEVHNIFYSMLEIRYDTETAAPLIGRARGK